MSTHIYAFGSVCRGEISLGSDIDLLAVVDERDERFNPEIFSIYSPIRIQSLWKEGNPFAWHLALEARLLFSTETEDFLGSLGKPSPYRKCSEDCRKFSELFNEGIESLLSVSSSSVFDLSMIFLSIRNIATCFSLGVTDRPTFSRRSALQLGVDSAPISEETYEVLERARILCTRGQGPKLTESQIHIVVNELVTVKGWMANLVRKVRNYE